MNRDVLAPLALSAAIVASLVMWLPPLLVLWVMLGGAFVGSFSYRVLRASGNDSDRARGIIAGGIFGLILGLFLSFWRAG